MAIKRFIFFFLLLLISQNSSAILLDNLYEVEQFIANKSQEERASALWHGLEKVVTKVTGKSGLLTNNFQVQGQDLKNKIDKYVKKYAYRENNKNELVIDIWFSEGMINQLLKSMQQDFLGKNRPLSVLWLSVEEDFGNISIVGGGQKEDIANQISDLASSRGLPIVLPLYDLTDKSKVKTRDIIMLADEPLEQAAKRYSADAIIAGKIYQFAGQWRCKWKLLGDYSITWETRGESLEQQLTEFIDKLSENIISKYLSNSGLNLEPKVMLNISGIDTLEGYAKIVEYLQGLHIVNQVNIVHLGEKQGVFTLEAEGGKTALKKLINLGKMLKEITTEDEKILYYNYKVGA